MINFKIKHYLTIILLLNNAAYSSNNSTKKKFKFLITMFLQKLLLHFSMIWKQLKFSLFLLNEAFRKITSKNFLISTSLFMSINEAKAWFYNITQDILNDSTLTPDEKIIKLKYISQNVNNAIGCIQYVNELKIENSVKLSSFNESVFFTIYELSFVFGCVILLSFVFFVFFSNVKKTTLSNSLIFNEVYSWNGSKYKYNLVQEGQKWLLTTLLSSKDLTRSVISWSLFMILSGNGAAKPLPGHHPLRQFTSLYREDVDKLPGVDGIEDLTHKELAVAARYFRMWEKKQERTPQEYELFYRQLWSDLAVRIERQDPEERKTTLNNEWSELWEILRGPDCYNFDKDFMEKWLQVLNDKMQLWFLRERAFEYILRCEFEGTPAPDNPSIPIANSGQELVNAYSRHKEEMARLKVSRDYLLETIQKLRESDEQDYPLDLGCVLIKAFGEYTDFEQMEVALEQRAVAEVAIELIQALTEDQFAVMRKELPPVCSTVISAKDLIQAHKLVTDSPGEHFPGLEDEFYYLLDPDTAWDTWAPQAHKNVNELETEARDYAGILEELKEDLDGLPFEFISEITINAAILAILTERESATAPLVMQPLAQLPTGLVEMPMVFGSRGAHVLTEVEVQKIYQNQGMSAEQAAIEIGATPPPNVPEFTWGHAVMWICIAGVIYYYRSEIWTFIEESVTSGLTNKPKWLLRQERQQELLRQKELSFKEGLKRIRDETFYSYAPKERDLRTYSQVKRDNFIEGLRTDWNSVKTFVINFIDSWYTWIIEHSVWCKIIIWYIIAIFLFWNLIRKLFPIEHRIHQAFFWRVYLRDWSPDQKRLTPEEYTAMWLSNKWPRAFVLKQKSIIFLKTIYYNVIYCSRLDFFLILNFLLILAWICCWFGAPWEYYIGDQELASAQYYQIDDSGKWSKIQKNPFYENLASDFYEFDLRMARWLEPQSMLYPDGNDHYISTRQRIPDLPLEGGYWTQFWAAQTQYGRSDWVYFEDLDNITNDVWNDFWVTYHYRGLYRYAPYSVECYNEIIQPTLIHGELKNRLWIPLVILNACIAWWNFINPRLGHWEDLANPDNLISGPDRVYMNETQKELIETEEKKVYAEKMDEAIRIWRAKGWIEDSPQTLEYIINASSKAWTESRNIVSEKHWLPYTQNRDRDGMPRAYNAQARGQDRKHVWDQIHIERKEWQRLCQKARYEQWTPYEKKLEQIQNEKGMVAYWIAWCYLSHQFNKKVVLPPYRSKWEELVQDDPHPDDEIYGGGG